MLFHDISIELHSQSVTNTPSYTRPMAFNHDRPDDLGVDKFREQVEAAKRLVQLRERIAYSQGHRLGSSFGTTVNTQVDGTQPFDRKLQDAQFEVERTNYQSQSAATNGREIEINPPPRSISDPGLLITTPIPAVQIQTSSHDPMMYPGLYAPSGFDMMSILIRVMQRPNPQIDVGFIDSSCALVLCACSEPDLPIVYSSDSFSALTNYPISEIVGRNCRFLQSPSGDVQPGVKRQHVDNKTIWELKNKLQRGEETQTCLVNYRKGGERFENLLTTIPIDWGDGKRYVVGFQADRRRSFG